MNEQLTNSEPQPPLTEARITELYAMAYGIGLPAVQAVVEAPAAPMFSELSAPERAAIRTERRHTYFA